MKNKGPLGAHVFSNICQATVVQLGLKCDRLFELIGQTQSEMRCLFNMCVLGDCMQGHNFISSYNLQLLKQPESQYFVLYPQIQGNKNRNRNLTVVVVVVVLSINRETLVKQRAQYMISSYFYRLLLNNLCWEPGTLPALITNVSS